MTGVYFLISTDTNGNEIHEDTFTDTRDLLEFLYKNDHLHIYDGSFGVVPALKDGLRIQKVDLGLKKVASKTSPLPKPVVRSADDPDFWVEVPSESVSGVKYSVGIRGRNIVSCSCPHFTNRCKYVGDSCKHMNTVLWNRYRFNLAHLGIMRIGRLTDAPKEV